MVYGYVAPTICTRMDCNFTNLHLQTKSQGNTHEWRLLSPSTYLPKTKPKRNDKISQNTTGSQTECLFLKSWLSNHNLYSLWNYMHLWNHFMHDQKAKTTTKTRTKPQHTHKAQNLLSHLGHRQPTSHKQLPGTLTSVPTALSWRTTPCRSPSALGTQTSIYIYISHNTGASNDAPWCPSTRGL